MTGLFSDMRRTAIGAGILLLLALFFAEPGGVGGSAVHKDADSAGAARPGQTANSAWFSAANEEPSPDAAPPPPAAGPGRQDGAVPGVIVPPGPTGPDFPAGLRAPR